MAETLTQMIQGTIGDSEMHIKRTLFKLSTEIGLLTRIIASYEKLDPTTLSRIRGQVVEDLKRTNGTLKLEDAIYRHHSGEI